MSPRSGTAVACVVALLFASTSTPSTSSSLPFNAPMTSRVAALPPLPCQVQPRPQRRRCLWDSLGPPRSHRAPAPERSTARSCRRGRRPASWALTSRRRRCRWPSSPTPGDQATEAPRSHELHRAGTRASVNEARVATRRSCAVRPGERFGNRGRLRRAVVSAGDSRVGKHFQPVAPRSTTHRAHGPVSKLPASRPGSQSRPPFYRGGGSQRSIATGGASSQTAVLAGRKRVVEHM